MAPRAASEDGVDRTAVVEFMQKCVTTLASEATRKALKDCKSLRPGPKLVEIQRKIWADLGVPELAGRRAIAALGAEGSSEDAELPELLRLREEFRRGVDAAYLRCLEDRRPAKLESTATMPRGTVLEFLEACGVLMDEPEVRERLRSQIRETGKMPEAVVNEVHGEAMELLGFEREHGRSCLADLGKDEDYAGDREVAVAVVRWRQKTSDVCIKLLHEYSQADGASLDVDEGVKGKLLELQAQEGLDAMSFDERSALLEKYAKKVNVVRALPHEGRSRYLEKLSESEKLSLAQAEILMETLQRASERQMARLAE